MMQGYSVMMRVREFRDTDWDEWRRMDQALFPENEFEDTLEEDMRALLARPDAAVFIAERTAARCAVTSRWAPAHTPMGAGRRRSGTSGGYVDPDVRRSGYGRACLQLQTMGARAGLHRDGVRRAPGQQRQHQRPPEQRL